MQLMQPRASPMLKGALLLGYCTHFHGEATKAMVPTAHLETQCAS